jgi:hypothetical protein
MAPHAMTNRVAWVLLKVDARKSGSKIFNAYNNELI